MYAHLGNWIYLIILLGIFELIIKGIALWKAGRNNQLYWFIAILILNTIGILPLVYLIWFQRQRKGKK